MVKVNAKKIWEIHQKLAKLQNEISEIKRELRALIGE
jgi:hypothetical protein